MPIEVNISEIGSFHNIERLQFLNHLVQINTTLSADFVAGYTNCHIDDAMYILFVLLNLNLAEGFTLIYDSKNDPHRLVDRRPFRQGLPRLPYKYSYMDRQHIIQSMRDLLVAFEFDIKENLKFTVKDDSSKTSQ